MRVPLEVPIIRNGGARLGHAAIAAVTGGVFTLALMAVVQGEMDLRLTEYFYETSVPAAHGHNVVNVILVDFRALDTLGEIFVVTVAGLSTFALLRLVGGRRRSRGEGGA
jgi:multicomponent Na+:H+ antiporter subunit A